MARFPETPSAKEAVRGIELALYRLGQRDDGEQVLAELVERFPASSFAADAQFQIAMRRYEAEDHAAAAEAFRRVVTQFPSFSAADRAHYLMGESYAGAGEAAEALSAYEQFLFFFPESPFRTPVRFRLASLRFEAGDYAQAGVDFAAVLDSEASGETSQAALYNLALCQIQLGQTDAARESLAGFRRGEAPGDPRAADVAYRLGDLHERAGRFEEAAREYEASLASGPDPSLTVELHYRIGTCRESLDEQDRAIESYRWAVAVGDRTHAFHLSALARLATLYESRERYADATAAYQELVESSDDPELVAAARERVEQLQDFTR